MNIKTNLASSDNYGGVRQTSNIKYIVIHYTGNDGDSDEANANYFKTGCRNSSAHYFVDNDSITQSVMDNVVAWSVGGRKYADCYKTGGGTFYGKCTNDNSISIELCDSVKNGKYDFTENTLKQAAELTRYLMDKYNVPLSNVIRHFDVTGKICPLPMVREPKQWTEFKARLSENLTEQKFIINGNATTLKVLVKNYTNYVNLKEVGKLLGKDVGWNSAKKMGQIQGHDLTTHLINNSSYCPIREVAAACGCTVTYENKVIIVK